MLINYFTKLYMSYYSFVIMFSNLNKFGCVLHLHLSLRDKWRLPLILVRVSKSLPLRESDAKIWACFVHNKTNEELVNSVAAALAERVPFESRQVLHSAAHSVLLPQLCPFPTRSAGNSSPRSLSHSGNATIRSLSRSGSAAPRSGSDNSTPTSRSPSPGPSPVASGGNAAIFPQPTSTALTSLASELCLPPRTPTTQRTYHWGIGEQVHITTEAGVTIETEPTLRRVHSMSNLLWPVRVTRAALTSAAMSLSAPTTPPLSPCKIVPLSTSEDTVDIEYDQAAWLAVPNTYSSSNQQGGDGSSSTEHSSKPSYNPRRALQQTLSCLLGRASATTTGSTSTAGTTATSTTATASYSVCTH